MGKMNQWIKEIARVKTVDQYKDNIKGILSEIRTLKNVDEMDSLLQYISAELSIKENIFSKTETQKNLSERKENLILVLNEFDNVKDKQYSIKIISSILNNFNVYCRFLLEDKIHGGCNETIKEHFPQIVVENEYDIQHLIYPLVRTIYEDARVEETEDTGHHMVRKDIVIDSEDIAIELKCTRDTMNERQLSEEIASDMIHYTNGILFFLLYDRANIIKNDECFRETYEKKKVDGKTIKVVIIR